MSDSVQHVQIHLDSNFKQFDELHIQHNIVDHCEPTLDREMGYEELLARQVLSQIPLKNYFIKQLKSSEVLQMSYDNENVSHKVWPSGIDFDEKNADHIVIKVGHRCSCWRRVDFDIQCKHELKIEPKFKALHWGHRWYNRKEFNKRNPKCQHLAQILKSLI